mgnify:FL=1
MTTHSEVDLDVAIKFTILSIAWGVSFFWVALVIDVFGWVGAVSIRSLIASAALFVIAKSMKKKLDFSIGVKPFFLLGFTTVALQLIGFSIAVPRIGTALTAIVVGAIPLFSAVIGRAWGIEHLSRLGIGGLFLGFLGIILLVGFPKEPFTGEFILGIAIALIGSIASAYGSNYSKRDLHSVGPWEQVIGSFFFGGIITAPLLLLVPFEKTPSALDWVNVISLALVCSSFCYVLYYGLIAKIGPTKSISVEFIVTVIAVLIGALYLGEAISAIQLFGGLFVLVGCGLIFTKPKVL